MENYTIDNLIRTNALPVIPLRGKIAFPSTTIAFEVGREMTLKAVKRASETADRMVFICTQKQTEQEEVSENLT
jgi:ATP-dependent Lon protease